MNWFDQLTGFSEENPAQVRRLLAVEGEMLRSTVNGRAYRCGTLETPLLATLRQQVAALGSGGGRVSCNEKIADVQALHLDPANAGVMFQVASQFNLLEMVSPEVTPERGVGCYQYDRTQGPVCAIAAGAGTIYRNYFVPVAGGIGQSAERQIDCLADIGQALGNQNSRLWQMRNGYALASREGLTSIDRRLESADESELDQLRGLLRIGIQWNSQVTLPGADHCVSQAYCSALPVAYSGHPASLWERFARLILEALYEATICAAVINAHRCGNHRLYLTLPGGGVFGNRTEWIADAIARAIELYREQALEIDIVSRRGLDPCLRRVTGDGKPAGE